MTCLCLTRNRRQWLPKAIDCYQSQTYSNRELLIISCGVDVRDLVPDDPSIRIIHVEGSPQIGDKRNFGCEQARGELIAHWDDDDWSGPDRLRVEVECLLKSGKAVTGFHSMRFTDGHRSWMYRSNEFKGLYAVGTSLLYKRDWWQQHRFTRQQQGEDNNFCLEARLAGQITSVDAGDLMYATIHVGNTSPRPLTTGSGWEAL